MAKKFISKLPPPWLKRIWIKDELIEDRSLYPFQIPLFRAAGFELNFDNPITIIVGDNGSGKSTLLEAIAEIAGFGIRGGSRDHQIFAQNPWDEDSGHKLGRYMGASWLPKITSGWFFRAESFFDLSQYLDRSAFEAVASGPHFLEHSHAEGFMRYFTERGSSQGLFIFDEPESALSPQKQFEFIKHLLVQSKRNHVQAIIATHSPILMAIPGAKLMQLDQSGLHETSLRETAHFRMYREFFLNPEAVVQRNTEI